jgi:hypothetical protein
MLLALTCCVSLATWVQPKLEGFRKDGRGDSFWDATLGEFRVLVSAQLFTKADMYLHAGYYPTIFDQAQMHEEKHIAQRPDEADHSSEGPTSEDHQHEHETPQVGGEAKPDYGFMGPPKDWVDRLGRNFYPSRHIHPKSAAESSEVFPWLRFSATLDPHRVETYSVAGYWLRQHMGRPAEAESFLREGWRNNPDSPEILLELGRAYEANGKDADRIRNLWHLALTKWEKQEAGNKEPDYVLKMQILANLIRFEEKAGNAEKASSYRRVLGEVRALRDAAAQAAENPKSH